MKKKYLSTYLSYLLFLSSISQSNLWNLMSDDVIIIKCTINAMHLNHPETFPPHPGSMEKSSSTKPVPDARRLGISILEFSEYRSFTCLVKFLLRYFLIFDAIGNEIVLLISLSGRSLLVYINARFLCINFISCFIYQFQ